MGRVVALVLTALTGFSGLVYEVVWQKYLATLLGSHSEATAAVLAIFLGGLAFGYAFFGRATARLVARARGRGRPPPLAIWRASGAHPRLLRTELAWLQRHPRLRDVLAEERLAELAALFGSELAEGAISPAAARAATDRFAERYHHAAPFDRRALLRLWQACREDPSQAGECAAGRQVAERRLGPLGSPEPFPIGLARPAPLAVPRG